MAYLPDYLDWRPVRSSNVAAVAYDPTFWRLYVRFKSGWVYAYESVPPALYQSFFAVPSVGSFVYYVLRNKGTDSRYAYRRVV